MIYTVPDYFREFRCLASDCPATCCAVWQIMIDDRSMRKYQMYGGGFGSRLANSIDWEQQCFLQYHGRCAFLNEENLCDIHLEAGPEMMCRTCREYPRHVEVYENEREISLSLSCPAVARMLLARKTPVRFCSVEKGDAEQEFAFDALLYSALQDCRSVLLNMAQDRSVPLALRMARMLALAHDVQNRINARRLFETEEVLERYQRPQADQYLTLKLLRFVSQEMEQGMWAGEDELLSLRWRQLDYLRDFEVLDPSWQEELQELRCALYQDGAATYQKRREQFLEASAAWETEYEQLLVYFLFTYFCGAVYEGDALKKVQMAVTSILILQELAFARWLQKGGQMEQEDRARLAWRYSRELEHSDPNLAAMEGMMEAWKEASFASLLNLLLR